MAALVTNGDYTMKDNLFLLATTKPFGWKLLALIGLMLAPFSSAVYAADGSLSYAGCIGQGVDGCTDLYPARPLEGAKMVAVSPDSHDVYALSGQENHCSIAHFRRETSNAANINGDLEYRDCIGQNVAGCTDINPDEILASECESLTVLNTSVYVISRSTMVHFTRNLQNGALMFAGCIGGPGCQEIDGSPYLSDMRAVTASPDGKNIYVASGLEGGALLTFERNLDNGVLHYREDECISVSGLYECRYWVEAGPKNIMKDPSAIAVSTDGGSLYMVSSYAGAITSYRRSSYNGELEYTGCIGKLQKGVLEACTPLPGQDATLETARAMAISGDDKSVYVLQYGNVAADPSSTPRSAVYHFSRAANGDLSYVDCIGNAVDICRSLDNPDALIAAETIVADYYNVYVAAWNGAGGILHFRQKANGNLEYTDCISGDTIFECETSYWPYTQHPNGLAIDPESRSVYVASGPWGEGASGVVIHVRKVPEPPPPLQEVCGNFNDDDADGAVNEDCPELCDDYFDNNGNGLVNEGCPEKCNGRDDNSDRRIDEGFNVGASCTVGAGPCQRTGTFVCRADGSGTQCNATPGSSSSETCNGRDDDCDGAVDETDSDVRMPLTKTCYSGPVGTDGVGQCHAGTRTCSSGSFGTCIGERVPATEIYNDGIDQDCNGSDAVRRQEICGDYKDNDGDGYSEEGCGDWWWTTCNCWNGYGIQRNVPIEACVFDPKGIYSGCIGLAVDLTRELQVAISCQPIGQPKEVERDACEALFGTYRIPK